MFFSLLILPFLFTDANAQITIEKLREASVASMKLAITSAAFKMCDVDMDLYARVTGDMNALENAGLDPASPMKAAGLDMDYIRKGNDAVDLSTAGVKLLEAGLDVRRIVTCMNCAVKENIKIGKDDRTALLLCGLRASGQSPDSLKVDKALKEATVLLKNGSSSSPPFIVEKIDLDAIKPTKTEIKRLHLPGLLRK